MDDNIILENDIDLMGLNEGDIIKKQYEVLKKLGDGAYAKVYLVLDMKTDLLYALKTINLRHLKHNSQLGPNLMREVKIHKRLDHPNILKFYEQFQDDTYMYFLIEYAHPGEICKILYKEPDSDDESSDEEDINDSDSDSDESDDEIDDESGFSEMEAKDYIYQIIQALKYLRSINIIHRDLKPENLLLNENGIIKLCDFGWATDRTSHSVVGTCDYNAPEMVKMKEYDYKSDIWSLGVVLFEFLYRLRPFHSKNEKETERKITNGRIFFPKEPKISDDAKNLIKLLLNIDPNKRPNYEDIEKHIWFKDLMTHNGKIDISNVSFKL
jgi:serine/threonine protein kinase